MKKRIFSFLLAALFILSMIPAAAADPGAEFPDMPDKTYWSYDALVSAVENGLLKGSGGNLMPKANLTRAQMAAIVNRAFGAAAKSDISAFSDVSKSDWFYDDVAKAVRMGTFTGTGGGKMSPNNPISREQAFTVVARALKLEGGDESVLSRFSDAGDISVYARGPISAMVEAGYVNGSGGKINPRNTITREEFAQVFRNVIKKYVRTAGDVTGEVLGNVIVNVPGVTLKGMNIKGDLIVGEGVGNGEITLDAVKVTGRVVVRGGGVNSIIIRNGTEVGSIVIGKTGDGGVRVRTEEGSHVEVVIIDDGLDTVILEGEFNQVKVDSDVEVVLRDADIVGLTIAAEGANVSLEGGTSVVTAWIMDDAKNSALSVDGDSSIKWLLSYGDGVTVSGDGEITSAQVSGDGTAFNVSGTQLTVDKGTKGVTENGSSVPGGSTVLTGGEPAHEHSWDGGTVTKEPTCTEEGKKVYTCSCGETKEEAIPALGHDWDDGVTTKEPTEEEDGVEVFTCRRCGATREEPVAFLAFAVHVPDGDFVLFRTLEEAIEEASKYENHNDPGEPEWTEYAVIFQFNPVSINNITIPAGHTLIVESDLKLTGDLNLGTSDYSTCPGMGTGRIMVELGEYSSLTIDDLTIYDGHDPASGIITSSGDGEETLEMISICGMRAVDKAEDPDGESVYARPWFVFEGNRGEYHEYAITKDFDLTRFFDGFLIEGNAGKVNVSGDLNLGEFIVWEGAKLAFCGEGASMSFDGLPLIAATPGADMVLTDLGGVEEWCVVDGNITYLKAKAATVEGSLGSETIIFCPPEDDEFVITVAPDGRLIFDYDNEVLPGVRIVNEGLIMIVNDNNRIGGVIENRSVMKFTGGEGSLLPGEFSLIEFTEGSSLVNSGQITLVMTDDEYGYRESMLDMESATFENLEGGILDNRGYVGFENCSVTNDGMIVNGSLTNVGEGENGDDAALLASGTVLHNSGRIVNNGYMNFEYVDYSQTAEARFETYNAGGLRIYAGSVTVPSGSEFKNEGYMNVVDRYGDGKYDICDLSGFEDFFTTWNVEGNDSNWCDFEAEVYDKDGYFAAVETQHGRADNEKYNRLDFLGNVTFEEDVALADFDHYWVDGYWDYIPLVLTDEGYVPAGEGEEPDEYGVTPFNTALTVAEGATLTVGNECTLHTQGIDFKDRGASGILKVDGTLITAARIDDVWGDDGELISSGAGEGRVEIWFDGSFDAGEGTVVNDGYFEVRYMEDSGDDGVYLGTFSRPGFTTLIGIPEDTVYAAEVRSTDGLLNALSWEAPEFFRLLVRDNETIALREDVTVPSGKSLEIEGASGFIVEYGATLTVEPDAFVNNRGDFTIWGDLVIDGSFENSQSLEIGAITGSETATVTVRGYLRNHDHIAVYPTGNIVIDGGSIENYGEMIDVTVSGAGLRGSLSGVRFTGPLTISGLNGDKWVHFHECSFCGDITMIAAENEDNLNVSFSECEFSDGLTVTVRVTGDTDCGYNAANLNFGCGETWYHLAPHIFGLGDDPGVYIGICDEAVSYELTLDGEPLPHTTELIPEDDKTHFWSDGHGWFTAGQGNAPDLALTVYMPGLPTVIFERVPLKPEWTFGD